jgi:outer membrane lipoprotein carrier protein
MDLFRSAPIAQPLAARLRAANLDEYVGQEHLLARGKPLREALEQVTIKKLDQRLSQTPALLLSGDVSKISESFDISAKEAGGVIDFTLKPKTKDTLFDSLRLSFRNGMVNDMQLIDSVGQRTNILFTAVKANEAIAASKFKFDIPKGADVIQE